jgi:shikimate kinase
VDAAEKPPENIVLIGFMGCGKSTVGREIGARLGYRLVDMDREIEHRAGRGIPAIFEHDGAEVFRDMESRLLESFVTDGLQRHIVSTGGGVVGRAANRALLRRLGYVVWIDAPFETILERTSRNRNRPLLRTGDPEARIRELMSEREPLYDEAAHLRIDGDGLSSAEIATGIIECARYFFADRS